MKVKSNTALKKFSLNIVVAFSFWRMLYIKGTLNVLTTVCKNFNVDFCSVVHEQISVKLCMTI